MSRDNFDSYEFSIKTKVLVRNVWHSIGGVDFDKRLVLMFRNGSTENVHYCDIEEIKEKTYA